LLRVVLVFLNKVALLDNLHHQVMVVVQQLLSPQEQLLLVVVEAVGL
jgi:hypothetical protein|tara:strand:- start:571 stop:711 length:141 start_codon:yes stop_codon:yes gene_type:complete